MIKYKGKSINIGEIDVPKEYLKLSQERKDYVCDALIDALYRTFDKYLKPEYNRIDFIREVLESSLITNEKEENFEICQVILDCTKKLNES